MKRFFTILFSLSFACLAWAQNNYRDGVVYTLAGDSLVGQINFATDYNNALRCDFRAQGSTEPVIYHPGQIVGYRLIDNGRRYVSHKVMEHGQEKEYFLEHLVEGRMSLYYKSNISEGSLFLFDEATLGQAIYQLPVQRVSSLTNAERRSLMVDASRLFGNAPKASALLWKAETQYDVVRAVVCYNDETCPDEQCIVFELRKGKTPKADRIFHFNISAGVSFTSMEPKGPYYDIYDKSDLETSRGQFEATMSSVSPLVTVGVDAYMPRVMPGLLMQGSLGLQLLNAEANYAVKSYSALSSPSHSGHATLKANLFTFNVGPAYEFQQLGRLRPQIHAGYSLTLTGSKSWSAENNSREQYIETLKSFCEITSGLTGYYAGASLLYSVGPGALVISADYSHHTHNVFYATDFWLRLGYQF